MFTDPNLYIGLAAGAAIGATWPFFFRRLWKKVKKRFD